MQAAVAAVGTEISNAFQGDAHALLVAVYKDPSVPLELRVDAAKKAVHFEKPALANTTVNATVRRNITDFSDAELAILAGEGSGEDGVAEASGITH